MGGQQLQDFEENFKKMLNEELFAKVLLVKNSFAEDLSSFSDLFLVEFYDLYKDLDKMWQEFKEMYQRNYFYLKSGTQSLYRVWNDLWSKYQSKKTQVKIIVDNLYKMLGTTVGKIKIIFDHKYTQYKVLFTVRILFSLFTSLLFYFSIYVRKSYI